MLKTSIDISIETLAFELLTSVGKRAATHERPQLSLQVQVLLFERSSPAITIGDDVERRGETLTKVRDVGVQGADGAPGVQRVLGQRAGRSDMIMEVITCPP